jgi:peptidoglycan/LPS O-acetylase OafA/YrhL
MKTAYFKQLDGLRALAAIMVMGYHYFSYIGAATPLQLRLMQASTLGITGVTLFFVLSGFLITRILLSSKGTKGYFRNFYARRALRILPLYYFYLIIVYAGYPALFNTSPAPLGHQLIFYGFLQNIAQTFGWNISGPGHYWSLAVEEHFYLFWPVVVHLFSNKQLFKVLLGIVAAALLLRIGMVLYGFPVATFTLTRMDSLAFGALLALYEAERGFPPSSKRLFPALMAAALAPALILLPLVSGKSLAAVQVFKFLLTSLFYLGLIGYVVSASRTSTLHGRFLQSPIMAYAGRISYGLYVFHPFAYKLTGQYLNSGNWTLNLFIFLGLAFTLAACSFRFIESPFLRLKKHFSPSPPVVPTITGTHAG